VVWESTGAVPLPPLLARSDRPYFVGRERARAHLDAAWRRARGRARQGLLVCGEPGIGKTTLMADTARAVHRSGATVLYGRCDEELGVAYQPFAEALRRYVADCALEQLEAHVDAHGSDLVRLVPDLARRLPDLRPPPVVEPEADRLRLFDAVNGLLVQASEEAPVLLVLDDLHWAGKPTLLLLTHLLRATDPAPILVAGTYRDTETTNVEALSQTLADLRRLASVEFLTLPGLDQEGVDAFVTAAAGHVLDDRGLALARLLRAETNGNPFFVGQVLRHLVETGAVTKRDGVWQVEGAIDQIGIPEGVREVVHGRLLRLSDTANRALTVGSVIGKEFNLDLLERVPNGPDGDALLDGLDEALHARLISEAESKPGHYAFAHALVRQTLYDGLTGARRARLHLRVGEALEKREGRDDGPHLSALAHHFIEAAPVAGAGKAVEYALRAAQRALSQVAFEEAAVVLERGLEVLDRDPHPDEGRRCDLLLALAQCRVQALDFDGMREASLRAADSARAVGSPERLAHAAYWHNARPIAGARDDVGIALCEEALAALDGKSPALRALVLATLALHRSFAGEGMGVDGLSQEALGLAQTTDDAVALGMARMARYFILWGSPHADEMHALAQQLMDAPVVTPSGFLASSDAYRLRAIARIILADRDGFAADAAEIERLGNELRSRYYLGVTAQWDAMEALLDGRFDEANELAAAQLDYAGGDPNFVNSYAAQLLQLHLEQGKAVDLEPLVVDAVRRNPGIPGFRAALALIRVQIGELEEARRGFDELAPDRFGIMPRDLLWPTTMALLIETCAALDDQERAGILHELMLPYSGLMILTGGGSYCAGAADRFLGMLAACLRRFPEAEARFRSALELEDRFRAPPLMARTRYWHARLLLQRDEPGDRARAVELLALALETAETLGMAGLAADAKALAASGEGKRYPDG
ncbi:MAG: AAA family ATPase, partial [Actinomycetota bacterium]|nr:AAA family ATPase [Actinomycetota bacterium]